MEGDWACHWDVLKILGLLLESFIRDLGVTVLLGNSVLTCLSDGRPWSWNAKTFILEVQIPAMQHSYALSAGRTTSSDSILIHLYLYNTWSNRHGYKTDVQNSGWSFRSLMSRGYVRLGKIPETILKNAWEVPDSRQNPSLLLLGTISRYNVWVQIKSLAWFWCKKILPWDIAV